MFLRPVILFAFGLDLQRFVSVKLREEPLPHAPILAFMAGTFFEAMLVFESLGIGPAEHAIGSIAAE